MMKSWKAIGVLLCIILLAPSGLVAGDLSGIAGAYADIGLGTRPLGMGGAYTAAAVDENSARWNPAGLGMVDDYSAGFSWTKQFNLVQYNYLAAAYPMQNYSLGMFIESAGDDVYSENTIGFSIGSMMDQIQIPSFLSRYVPVVPGLALGSSFKIRWSGFGNNDNGGIGQVTGNAFGFGIDLGAMWKLPWNKDIQLGILWRDLINTLRWSSNVKGVYTEGVPARMTFGVSYAPSEKTLLTTDISPSFHTDTRPRFAMGMEYRLNTILAFRAGVAQNFGTAWINRDVTLGLGIEYPVGRWGRLQAGVSYIFDELVNTPRVGLAFVW